MSALLTTTDIIQDSLTHFQQNLFSKITLSIHALYLSFKKAVQDYKEEDLCNLIIAGRMFIGILMGISACLLTKQSLHFFPAGDYRIMLSIFFLILLVGITVVSFETWVICHLLAKPSLKEKNIF